MANMKRHYRGPVFAMVLLLGTALAHAASDDTPDWVESFCNQVAATVYHLAWPTAKYESWQFRRIVDAPGGGVDLTVRLYGRSAFDDSDLYTDVIFNFNEDGLHDAKWGPNNAVLFPPGASVGMFVKSLENLQLEKQPSPQAP